MADVRVDIDYAEVEKFLYSPGHGVVNATVARLARRVAAQAKRNAPVRTGRLRSSIRSTEPRRTGPNEMSAQVEATASYASFIHDGTSPHVIRPKKKRALQFNANGQLVFSRKVNHPGTKANRFLTDALETEVRRFHG